MCTKIQIALLHNSCNCGLLVKARKIVCLLLYLIKYYWKYFHLLKISCDLESALKNAWKVIRKELIRVLLLNLTETKNTFKCLRSLSVKTTSVLHSTQRKRFCQTFSDIRFSELVQLSHNCRCKFTYKDTYVHINITPFSCRSDSKNVY